MDHFLAQSIFHEIQQRPYRLSVVPDDNAQNCFFKNIEFIRRMATLGYAVRGRVADTYWDPKIFPKEILDLEPKEISDRHFYTEVFLDDQWRIMDPSFQPFLEQYGFTIGSWDNGESCFPLTKIYSQEEAITFMQKWLDPDYVSKAYEISGEFWRALDKWFVEKA